MLYLLPVIGNYAAQQEIYHTELWLVCFSSESQVPNCGGGIGNKTLDIKPGETDQDVWDKTLNS